MLGEGSYVCGNCNQQRAGSLHQHSAPGSSQQHSTPGSSQQHSLEGRSHPELAIDPAPLPLALEPAAPDLPEQEAQDIQMAAHAVQLSYVQPGRQPRGCKRRHNAWLQKYQNEANALEALTDLGDEAGVHEGAVGYCVPQAMYLLGLTLSVGAAVAALNKVCLFPLPLSLLTILLLLSSLYALLYSLSILFSRYYTHLLYLLSILFTRCLEQGRRVTGCRASTEQQPQVQAAKFLRPAQVLAAKRLLSNGAPLPFTF
jgi:hypothetical protein